MSAYIATRLVAVVVNIPINSKISHLTGFSVSAKV